MSESINQVSYEVFNCRVPKGGALAMAQSFDFSAAAKYDVDLELAHSQDKLEWVQGIFVDNSANLLPVTITMAVTNQVVSVPSGYQGYISVLIPNVPRFSISSSGVGIVQVQLLNFPVNTSLWPATRNAHALGNMVTSVTPVIQSAAYSTGNVLGSLMTFSNIENAVSLSDIVQTLILSSKGGMTGVNIDCIIFDENPSASTFTDKAALAINAADISKVCGYGQFSTWINGGTPSFSIIANLALATKKSGATSLYAVLVVRGSVTPASTSDLTLKMIAVNV